MLLCSLLQAPHSSLIRAALVAATPNGATCALDLACGSGAYTPCLAATCAPGALVLGLDRDQQALKLASVNQRLVGDGLNLPLRSAVFDLIWCSAALSLFADRAQALSEMVRILRPGGALVVTVAGERWVRRRTWPSELPPALPLPPADALGSELCDELRAAGLSHCHLSAYLLEPAGLAADAAQLPLADGFPAMPLAIGEPEPLPVLLVARAFLR
ncbi:class I SAM-dependent methyltransferase [Candidatus Viridilinea mediisalina]|uniref:Methyltransferase type 11 domain-containing protein n=1 Tax=Candidatus Viridilinea mediisalina TaxID=2024553 RepID=A0A2A6RGX5_9CHLR|nr:class I SAM-dependent methyltransferase [Candidatus Viridilinea mediisalina]PDW02191.1 hypothetical protein CJ255_15195 [Candidatus Viridilinea mediisalina]